MKTIKASGIPVHCAHVALRDVTTLVANPRNPNKHGDAQVALLAKIIRHQGWRAPITISRRSGFIVSGHGRLQAALLLQVEQVPIDEQDFATEADEWAHLIADNRISELAENDNAMMKELLGELDGSEFDMDLTGFTGKEMDFWLHEDMVISGGEQGQTPKDHIEDYEQSTVRQIVLIMDVEEFDEIMAKIETIKKEHKLENNTAAALTAIREYANIRH